MLLLIIIKIIIITALFEPGWSFIITLDAHESECFYDSANVNDMVTITFEVMEGGFKDVGVEISGPDGDLMHHEARETTGSLTFTAIKKGRYKLCFDNEISTLTPKIVMFQFHVMKPLDYYADPSKRTDDVLEQAALQTTLNLLSARMGAVRVEQEYMHYRYRGHLDITDSVQDRILAWMVFGPMMLLITTVLEVYYLKRFFEFRRVV
ncbi:transmembrane emp24 domain-containing protein 2 [Drosophila serrata]|uniref:transmembrane emp24 domain-containing protein 2 n=1 Tax=Drosophila serrata TaxID=7274 RepID=UPI000A1D08DD|nr:transmembrane emp24 domain-containing protein 2 [Drosophila serrata]